jgi:hypothetical protein
MLLSCFPSDVCFWEGGGPSGLGRVIGTSEANLEGEVNNTRRGRICRGHQELPPQKALRKRIPHCWYLFLHFVAILSDLFAWSFSQPRDFTIIKLSHHSGAKFEVNNGFIDLAVLSLLAVRALYRH